MTAAVATLLLTLVSTAGVCFPLRNRGGDATSLAPLLAAVVLWSVGLVLGMEVLSQFHALGRPGLIGLAVAIPALMFLLTRRLPPVPPTSSQEAWPVAIPLALLLGGIGVLCFPWLGYGLTQPVRPVSDAPIYHLPFILRWREAGWLEPMPTPFGELGATYFPANGDLWLAWLAILDGDDSLARVGGWPWLFVAAIALAAIGRRLGGDRASACVPPAFWLTMPFVQFTSSLGLVDIPFAAWYLCGLYFLIDAGKRPSPERFPSLLLSALALGLAAGTKTIGIVVGFPLILILLWLARSGVTRFVMTLAAFLLPCFYWYLRNCLYGGNPLYPLHVDLFGITLFPGWYDGAAMVETSSYHVPYFDFANFRAVFALVFDPRLVWLWPAVPALSLILGIFHRPARPAAALGLLAALYFALFWFVIPYNTQQRFLLPALGIALLPLGLLRGRWSLASGVLLMIALAAALEDELRAESPDSDLDSELLGVHAPVDRLFVLEF
ncbi:MAG TPA: hypothetical protein VNC50_12080, partial [Planctomycetia bacterium]|nr:hypothetical protein [Planctomycetia bacterium]